LLEQVGRREADAAGGAGDERDRQMTVPEFGETTCAVTNAASSLARKATAAPISRGVARRGTGSVARYSSPRHTSLRSALSVGPGATESPRPAGASSSARALVSPTMAPFAAQ